MTMDDKNAKRRTVEPKKKPIDHAMDSVHYFSLHQVAKQQAFGSIEIKKVRWWHYFYLWAYPKCRIESTVGKIKYTAWYYDVNGVVYLLKDTIQGIK